MPSPVPERRARRILALAAVGVGLAAADTYVVVLALPDMMAGVGIPIDELHRATPVVSGFLLGYVAGLPLIGRLSDLVPRRSVLLGCLALFAVGSAVTALAIELPVLVGGRVLQGIGGGGLVPATLALVADLWPPRTRGLPLGVVGAVQEFGSVLGPLLGALVLAVADWRAIFWLNVVLAAGPALGLAVAGRGGGGAGPVPPGPGAGSPPPGQSRRHGRPRREGRHGGPRLRRGHDGSGRIGGGWLVGGRLGGPRARRTCLVVGLACAALALAAPAALATDVVLGVPFIPLAGTSRALTPLGLLAAALVVAGVALELRANRSLLARLDLPSASLVAVALGCLVLTFAVAEPEREVVGPWGYLLVPVGVVAVLAYAVRRPRVAEPLVPRSVRGRRVALGLAVSASTGVALVAVVVDVPLLARLTLTDDQTQAALVLVRFLIALPIGAVAGGALLRRLPPGLVAASGLALAAGAIAGMTGWERGSLEQAAGTSALLLAAGGGLGLAIAPVNAAVLAEVDRDAHGAASSLLVLARMVGMIAGIALLTAVGLRRYHVSVATLPDPLDGAALLDAGLVQVHTAFAGAAVCVGIGAFASLGLGLRRAPTCPTGVREPPAPARR